MSREKQLVKSTLVLSLGTLLPKIASFVTLPIYTAMLTKDEYGTYDLVNILVSLFIPIVTLQIQQAAFRYLIEVKDKNAQENIVSNVYFFVLPIIFIALFILYFVVNAGTNVERILICLFLFLQTLVGVTQQVARGFGGNKEYSISAIINAFLNVILVIIFLLMWNWGFNGLLLSLNISIFIAFVYLLLKINIFNMIHLRCLDFKCIRELLHYSWPMVPNSVSLWIINMADRVIIIATLGIEKNAIYAVANKIPQLCNMIYTTFNLAWQESASIAASDKDRSLYYSQIFEQLFGFLSGIMALIIGATPILFMILIRGSYEEAYNQMPILFMGFFFSCISSFYGGIYVALKKTKSVGISSIISAAIALLLTFLFIKKIGLYAASISTVISFVFLAFFRFIDIRKSIKIHYNWKKIILTIFILIIMCILCFVQNNFINVVNTMIGIGVFIVLNWSLIKQIFKRIRKNG